MQIIGEKINGTRKRVAQAILDRDADFIQDLARRQVEGGANWLDANAGTSPDREVEDLIWLVETIQSAVDVPLCLDSPNPQALQAAIGRTHQTPMINSINAEPGRLEGVLPIVAEHGCPVIALAMDGKQIPPTSEARLAVMQAIVSATRASGVPDEKLYMDPLTMTIATNTQNGLVTLDTMRLFRHEFPQAHLVVGLSNISFGLPARSHVNCAFATLALEAGLDSAILDPLDRELRATILAAQVVLGKDRNCLGYTRAYRAGVLTPAAQGVP